MEQHVVAALCRAATLACHTFNQRTLLPLLHPALLSSHVPLPGLEDVTLGSLEDLRRATKGGMDPNGLGASRLASDVLWSDPVGERGFQPNVARGVGMCFGPDVTEVRWCGAGGGG